MQPDTTEHITLTEAAKRTRRSRTAVWKACQTGRLSRFQDNRGIWRVRADDVARLFPLHNVRPATSREVSSTGLHEELGTLRERCTQYEKRIEEIEARHQQEQERRAEQHEGRLAELEADRDAWRAAAEDWQAWARRPWWRRLFDG